MKRVSFNVAKAIKEAGYPQKHVDGCDYFDAHGIGGKPRGKSHYLVPTYLEVWFWLWREKNIQIFFNKRRLAINEKIILTGKDYNDPEEPVIEGIEYLVDNNLIDK